MSDDSWFPVQAELSRGCRGQLRLVVEPLPALLLLSRREDQPNSERTNPAISVPRG